MLEAVVLCPECGRDITPVTATPPVASTGTALPIAADPFRHRVATSTFGGVLLLLGALAKPYWADFIGLDFAAMLIGLSLLLRGPAVIRIGGAALLTALLRATHVLGAMPGHDAL